METIIKKAVVLTTLASALILTLATPLDDSPTWILDIVEIKVAAVVCWVLFALLNKGWRVCRYEE